MKHTLLIYVLLAIGIQVSAQQKAEVTVRVDKGEYQINKHIYGHFSEHLGRGIYGGLWVGENSSIPNINGVRKDIIDELKQIKIPNLRWPGSSYADE